MRFSINRYELFGVYEQDDNRISHDTEFMRSVCLPMQALSFGMGRNTGQYFLGQECIICTEIH